MRPLEPDSGDAQDKHTGLDIDHTFRHLVQAEHAPADFHAQVMARAEQLPPPLPKKARRPAVSRLSLLRLPRPATVVLASILLLCMAGLGYLYLQIMELQALAEQEQRRQQQPRLEVAQLRQAYAARQRREGKFAEALAQGERGALAEVSLEIPQSPAEGDGSWSVESVLIGLNEPTASHEPSMLAEIGEVLQRTFKAVWNKVRGVTDPAPTEPKPSQ